MDAKTEDKTLIKEVLNIYGHENVQRNQKYFDT